MRQSRNPPQSHFTAADLSKVIDDWDLELRWFPTDPEQRAEIRFKLMALVGGYEELMWLRHAVLKFAEWRGFSAVRNIYAARYPPKDGIGPDDYDGEMRYITAVAAPPDRLVAASDPDPELDAELKAMRARMRQKIEATVRRRPTLPRLPDPTNLVTEDGNLVSKSLAELERDLQRDKDGATDTRRTPEQAASLVADLEALLAKHRKDQAD